MSDSEYVEQLQRASDAIHDLLDTAEPGTGSALHGAYNCIKRALATEALDGQNADDAAWASIAEAASRALMLDGLSAATAKKVDRVLSAARCAAGMAHLDSAMAGVPSLPSDAKQERRADEEREERRAWRRTPRAVKERVVLEALGDERLSCRELWALTHRTHTAWFTDANLRVVLRRLVDAGELDYTIEQPTHGGRSRAVYSRRAPLSGPIEALERAFNAPQEGPGAA